MANAQLEAPLKKEKKIIDIDGEKVTEGSSEHLFLTTVFDVDKKYMFNLATPNPIRELPVMDARTNRPDGHQQFKPSQNIVLSSQIVWNGQRRNIRYYDGCTTLFTDGQPKDKDVVDQLIKSTNKNKYKFLNGKFGVYGDDRMILLYMYACSWNVDSQFRTRTATPIFVPVDKTKQANATFERLEKMEKALKLSKDAKDTKMLIHARFLQIPDEDYDSNNKLTNDEIRMLYREEAIRDPSGFIESYDNKSVEMKYYIDKALTEGLITNTFNSNKATWATSNIEICDISGLVSHPAIAEKLLEFSQLDAGNEFANRLKSLYN